MNDKNEKFLTKKEMLEILLRNKEKIKQEAEALTRKLIINELESEGQHIDTAKGSIRKLH